MVKKLNLHHKTTSYRCEKQIYHQTIKISAYSFAFLILFFKLSISTDVSAERFWLFFGLGFSSGGMNCDARCFCRSAVFSICKKCYEYTFEKQICLEKLGKIPLELWVIRLKFQISSCCVLREPKLKRLSMFLIPHNEIPTCWARFVFRFSSCRFRSFKKYSPLSSCLSI